jgi:glycosyltransferase involved in cell wall biosynthesis
MSKGRRIRVLHVLFSLDPGGMENGVVNVANRLPEEEFDVWFCCLEKGGAFVERLKHPENVVVLNRTKPGFSKRTVLELMWTVLRLQPDVVHSHNMGPLTYAVCGTLFGLLKPVLQGEHGVFQGDQREPHRIKARGRLYRACRKIQAVSEGLRQFLIEQGYDGSKIVSIINGVDTDRFQPVDRAKVRAGLGLATEGPWMGIVGRFDINKRHLLLIDAFNAVAKEFPTARLLILGDKGNERENIHHAVQASPFSNRIHLAGFQSNPLPYNQSLDLLTAPSPMEGLSNAVLESMACGVPVLGHLACGNTEVVTNGVDGFLSEVDTEEQLAGEMRRLLGDPGRLAEAGDRARAAMVDRFSISKMVENYARLYREIAGQDG